VARGAAAAEILPALGLAGTLLYGLLLPAFLYKKLAKAAGQHCLDSPACRGRYGFLYDRFKPGKWGAEFRILSRKTMLLFATTLLAEYPYPCIAAQIAIVTWSMFKQWQEHPYAEVGSKAKAFLEKHPDGATGWSRGDKLELLALSGQLGNVAITLICSLVKPKGAGEVAVSVATLAFVFLPAQYAVHIIWTEWWHKWCSKKATAPADLVAAKPRADAQSNGDGEQYSNPVLPVQACSECGTVFGGAGTGASQQYCGECGAQVGGVYNL
jgi:hypothetical protein